MTRVQKTNAIDIVGLKKPTALDEIIQAVPKPKGAVPSFGLPRWKVMPLESKIPMVPGPEGVYNFTREKIGKNLWVSSTDTEFNLTDPYGYEMKLIYDALHDKHLVPFFSKPNNIKHLLKAGLITSNMYVKCSLQDYNMYRKYLRRLHCHSIRKEIKKRARLFREARALKFAEDQAEKEGRRLREKEGLFEARKRIIEKRRLEDQLKVQRQKDKARKLRQRLKLLESVKREEQRLRRARGKERSENTRRKQEAVADIERFKVIKTLREWSKKEHIRRETRRIRIANEMEEKRKAVEEKWKMRQDFQRKQIHKEQFLLQCVKSQREQFIKDYSEKIDKETKRMRKLFEDMRLFVRCYVARHLPGHKERICCRKVIKTDKVKENGKDKAEKLLSKPPKLLKFKTEKNHKKLIVTKGKKSEGMKHTSTEKRARKKEKEPQAQEEQEAYEKSEPTHLELDIPSKPERLTKEILDSRPSQSIFKDECKCEIIKATKLSKT